MLIPLLALLSGYALGSVSFALLVVRAKGIDLRQVGSGNLGATNASRALGSGGGLFVFFLDVAKGFVPAALWSLTGSLEAAVLAGLGAYLGHIWPIYFGLRGGKGVATLIGALLWLAPVTLVTAAPFALALVALTKIMSLASLSLGVTLPLLSWWRQDPQEVFWFTAGASAFLFWTHRSNLQRLVRGEEKKFGRSKSNELRESADA